MEIITVQQVNQNKALPELRTINSDIWIRMLEDDRKRLKQTVSFSYQKPKKNPAHFLAQHDFLTKTYSDNVIKKVWLHF